MVSSARMVRDRRGQLDALLDVELVLPRLDGQGPDATTIVDSGIARAAIRPPAVPLAPGTQLGKYRLERLLGAGGMGVVWQARDVDLDRAVALKVLRPSLDGDDVARSRLVREARAMARLHHPNVIAIFDAATLDGRDVIAMELFDGETMASWLSRKQPRDAIVAAIVAAGRGLAAAHAAGMIHRDFKPHNVLVDRRGRVVVTDFGLARAVPDSAPPGPGEEMRPLGALDSELTVPGTMLGTPAYMAPEALAGEASGKRADQFAFCATAWEALAGIRPFVGKTAAEICDAHDHGELCAPERVPRRLRAILERGLSRAPRARWPSIDALLGAMLRAWLLPRRIAVALACAAGIAAVAAGALALRRAPWQPQIVALPAFEENSDGAAISPDGTHIAYVSDRERTGTFRVYLAALPSGESRAITGPADSFQTPRWMRDGSALLLVRWDPASYMFRIVRQPIAGGPYTDLGSGIHADDCGDALAIADSDRSTARLVLQHRDGTRQVLASSTTDWITLPRCDRDGQRIAFTRGPTVVHDPIDDVFVVDRAGKEIALTRDHMSHGGTFTPDGRSVVFTAMRSGKIQLFEVPATGGEARQLTFDAGPHFNPDISPDGRMLVFNLDTSATFVIAGGAGPVRRLTTRREMLGGAVPTRDGKYLVAHRIRARGAEIVAISTSDGSERTLADGRTPFPSLDDRRVLFGALGDPPRLLSVPIDGGPVTVVAELPGKLVIGADGPDGPEIQINRDGSLEAWRVTRDGRLERRSREDQDDRGAREAREPRGIAGFVIPAPYGGWRAVQTFDTGYHLRFVAPGDPLAAGAHEVAPESDRPMWLDDRRIAYAARGAFHIVDVTTGAEIATVPGPEWGQAAVLAADGVRWYDIQLIGHVTRHLMVNFGDRPRP
jgi:predicted Ser/Thr protein kinase